ncbi:YhdT family protein [Halobacillus sp. A1]|uniref:YhdT family protein n=1 Tax=Halobacillus sp. A1 TaxID=2880262 RepID=UPI0020A65117|nr:YhdT family protein [Halobacillus sp. A1]MCP3032509.1 YhdT family protein [Halobacillus sp. A1]
MPPQEDYRFKIANREALIGVGLAVINFVWWFAFAYGLGSRPPEEYSYVFGIPSWFFYSCIVGFILIAALVTFVVKVFFVEVPLDDEEEGDRS